MLSAGFIPLLAFALHTQEARENVFALLLFILFAPLAISIHRKIILQENFSIPFFQIPAQALYWRYILTSSFVYLVPLLALVNQNTPAADETYAPSPMELFLGFGIFVMIVTSPIVITRFCVAPSLIATGRKKWITTAWRLSRKNAWRILFTYFLVNMGLATLILAPLQEAAEAALTPNTRLYTVLILALQILNMFFLSLLNASKISFIFQELRHNIPPEDLTPVVPSEPVAEPQHEAPRFGRSHSIREHHKTRKRLSK